MDDGSIGVRDKGSSQSLKQHWYFLTKFQKIIETNGLVVSAPKMKLCQTTIRFLGHNITRGTITPISRAIEFADKFPDKILDKQQLQRFLGSPNYIGEFYKDLRKICKPLFNRLKKNPSPWTDQHTAIIQQIKKHFKKLPCLGLASPHAFKIMETDASALGYGEILKQRISASASDKQLVRYHSHAWNPTQQKYSTVKQEVLAIVLCVSKFQDDLLNQKFLIRVDCQSAKDILLKDVKNLAFK